MVSRIRFLFGEPFYQGIGMGNCAVGKPGGKGAFAGVTMQLGAMFCEGRIFGDDCQSVFKQGERFRIRSGVVCQHTGFAIFGKTAFTQLGRLCRIRPPIADQEPA